MNGVSHLRSALPATTVLRVGPGRPMPASRNARGAETVLAAVQHPPRRAEVSPLGALLPEVLARYGIEVEKQAAERFEAVA
jgi:hypothetical protein